MDTLQNKVVVVAGGSGGIGSSVCRLLADRGATLIVANRSSERCERLMADLGRQGSWIEADLRYHECWEAVVREVQTRFSRIDALIHCQGLLIPGPFAELAPADIESVVRTNVLSVLYGTRAGLPAMGGRGQIIVVGSLGGVIPMAHEALYSATKFAVRGFCLALQEELRGSGIRVSLLSPSSVATPMLDTEAHDEHSSISFVTAPLSSETIAAAVLNLLERPRTEVILPHWAGLGPRGLRMFFSLINPVLHVLGRNGQRKYLQNRTRAS